MLEDVKAILPAGLARRVMSVPQELLANLEEIRIREARPLELVHAGGSVYVTAEGETTTESVRAYRPSPEDCGKMLDLLTNHSLYSYAEELRQGFITIAGGHRVGLAGHVVLERGSVKMIHDVRSFNVRIARERIGVSHALLPFLVDRSDGMIRHTLIVSPPRQGKTTVVRDLARSLSSGGIGGIARQGWKVGIIDERSELAGCVRGTPTFDLGPRTDVLDGCPKAEGMMMMIRSMSPDVLVVDEIGRAADAEAVHEALHAGIRILATAHGRDAEDVCRRPVLKRLLGDGVFSRIVVLARTSGTGTFPDFSVYDADEKLLGSGCLRPAPKSPLQGAAVP